MGEQIEPALPPVVVSASHRTFEPLLLPTYLPNSTMPLCPPMDDATRAVELPPVLAAGWTMVEGREAISKTYKFETFNQCWQWMSSVALAAEALSHHPDWRNNWITVEVVWHTHEGSNLSIRDVQMAKPCDEAYQRFAV